MASLASPAAGATDGPPKDVNFFRTPTLRIPRIEARYKIDGWIDRFERQRTAETRAFITFEADAQGRGGTIARLAHDGSNLYIAVEMALSPGQWPRAAATQRDAERLWKSDDAVELRIGTREAVYGLIGNAAGTIADIRYDPSDFGWTDKRWRFAARVIRDRWQAEFLIPAALFGRDTLTPQRPLRLDIIDNQKSAQITKWAYRGRGLVQEIDRWPRLIFADERAPRQIDQHIGDLGETEFYNANTEHDRSGLGLLARIGNPSDASQRIETWAALYRADADQSLGYYTRLTGLLDSSGTAQWVGLSEQEQHQRAVAEVLRDYERLDVFRKPLTLPAGGHGAVRLNAPRRQGRYLVAWRIRDADNGRVISAGAYPWRNAPPLAAKLDYYYLTGERIDVTTRTPSTGDVRRLRFAVLDGAEASSRAQKTVPATKPGEAVTASLDTADWPAGDYTLRIAALNEAGEVVHRSATPFKKPKPPWWWQTEAGTRIDVPEPWSPVQVDGDEVQVWGRRYIFDGGALPTQIHSQGKPLLASPMRLSTNAEGESVDFNEATVETKTPEAVTLKARASDGRPDIRATTRVEFDGMMRIDLTLQPSEDSAAHRIERLWLELPLRREVAAMFRRYPLGLMPAAERPGEWDARFPQAGHVDDSAWSMPFTPSMALFNDEVGLEWFAEHDRGWSNRDRTRRIEIVPGEDAVVLRVRLIDKPTTLTRPRRITFGLHPWPVKPRPKNRLNVSNYLITRQRGDDDLPRALKSLGRDEAEVRTNLQRATSLGLDVLWAFHWNRWAGDADTEPVPHDYPELANEQVRQRVAMLGRAARDVGVPIIGHVGYGIPPTASDFRYYGKEMARYPLLDKGWFGYKPNAASPVFIDAYTARLKRLAERYHWSGAQFDDTWTPRYTNARHDGSAWQDAEGNWHGRYPIFGVRRFAKRVYNIYHGEVDFDNIDKGFVYVHPGQNWSGVGPIDAFADALHAGEHTVTLGARHLSGFDLQKARARYPRAMGVPLDWLHKYGKAPVGNRGRIAQALMMGWAISHNRVLRWLDDTNYDKQSLPIHRIWAAMDWVDAQPDDFVGFWASDRYVDTGAHDALYASLWRNSPRRVLLALGNWQPRQRTVDVTLRPDALGLRSGPLTAVDAITGKPVAIKDARLRVSIRGDGYRLIRIHTSNP